MQLARWEVHGAPVVDDAGRCVGVLSVSDLARWVAGRGESGAQSPRTCSFQEKSRGPGGREAILCRLPEGVCPLQRLRELPGGKLALACTEEHSVPVDWQMVELEPVPGDSVRACMTTAVVTAEPATPVPELARSMLDHDVARLVVVDPGGRPIGIVSANDLLRVLARPDLTATVDPQ